MNISLNVNGQLVLDDGNMEIAISVGPHSGQVIQTILLGRMMGKTKLGEAGAPTTSDLNQMIDNYYKHRREALPQVEELDL